MGAKHLAGRPETCSQLQGHKSVVRETFRNDKIEFIANVAKSVLLETPLGLALARTLRDVWRRSYCARRQWGSCSQTGYTGSGPSGRAPTSRERTPRLGGA